MKRLLSVFLALVLVLGTISAVIPVQAARIITVEGPRVELPRSRTGIGGPTLAEGNHALYLDRLHGLPQYALDFYQWLIQNGTAQGALADPSLETDYFGEYYHTVAQLSGTQSFDVSGVEDLYTTASNLAMVGLTALFNTYCANAGAVYNAFDRDHPEVFWLSGLSSYSYLGQWSYSLEGTVCTVSYGADMIFFLQYPGFDVRDSGYRTPEAVAAAVEARDRAVEEILSGCTQEAPWEQVRYLNETLTKINAYNKAGGEGRWLEADQDAWKCISALEGRTGDLGPVCEGYARAFKVLCDRLGIPCVLVNGMAKSKPEEEPLEHMWNNVYLDGSWYAVDVTWNDPYVRENPDSAVSRCESEQWLLVGDDTEVAPGLTFRDSREIRNDVSQNGLWFTNGPVLSSGAYEPPVERYCVTGTVTALRGGDEPVAVQLCDEQAGQIIAQLSVTDGTYCFENVAPGEYLLSFSKPGFAERSCPVTVQADTPVPGITLRKMGDMNGDARINVGDTAILYSFIKKTTVITDSYILYCADLNGDGRINVGDTARIYATVRGL